MSNVTNIASRGPLHHVHLKRGASMGVEEGWELPLTYSAEGKLGSELVLADESALPKFLLQGSGLESKPKSLGFPARSYSLGVDESLLLCPLKERAHAAQALAGDSGLLSSDVTSGYACFLLSGPRSQEVLAKLFPMNLSSLGDGASAVTGLLGTKALLARHGAAWRIVISREDAYECWHLLENAGREFGLKLAGWKQASGLLAGES